MFDKDDKGFISLTDLQSILYNAFTMDPNEVEILFNKVDAKKDGLITFGKNIF
jgi:Ca2+-binding EF-hand superfamily protein